MSTLYPITGLFFYRLIFMGWLLFGEALFTFRLEKKPHFPIRALLAILICLLFAFVFPIPTNNPFYSMMMFLAMFGCTYACSLFVFNSDWKMLFFTMVCGYTTEHIAYETYTAVTNFFFYDMYSSSGGLYSNDTIELFNGPFDMASYFVSFILIYYLIFILFANRVKKGETYAEENSTHILISGAVFIFMDIVINSLVTYYGNTHYENIYMGFVAVVNVFACLVGLLFVFEMFYRNHLKRENEIIKELRREESAQYKMSKKTIDLINIKVHDFRHQIRKIGRAENINGETIENISNLIHIYDSNIKTSNSALNVILSEKSLFCSENGIKFSVIADGEVINFMSEEDTYSLFGNIIDNAIEAVKDLPEDQRMIRLKITKTGNMVSVSEKNSYAGKLELADGLPKTTKGDETHHGYGMKSIRMITSKYNGTMEINLDDHLFNISLLFIVK